MLLQRVITASILAPLVVLAIFQLPHLYFAIAWGLVMLVAAWEWSNLAGIKTMLAKIAFLIIMSSMMVFLHYWTVVLEVMAQLMNLPDIRSYSGVIEGLMIPAVLFWVWVMFKIRNSEYELLDTHYSVNRKLLVGGLAILAAWFFLSRLIVLEEPQMTLFLFVLIWGADIGAYFVGKKFGKTKLAVEISPGKTVEGMYGALASAAIIGLFFTLYFHFSTLSIMDFLLLSMITVLVSIYGDLFFSAAKRLRGVKDSGSILPGHGGILDRLDSIIAAAPIFYSGVWFIRWMYS